MKKVLYFVLICLWGIGIVGGFCSTISCKAYPCAVGVIVAGLMSWDNVKELARKLMEE